ncbi:MAG TPA: selenocysteine-specific translation elongation factor, partial [Candidatus Limnocylindrales bacterium]|nr:selenocysteine-specific translation elongation factor [Candidatus Limnocylindrales bacterium]
MTVVIGTAGHIDHGKTTLLRALTGIDADRLPEERARGMTIDLGYAHLSLDDGTELDFVDVPGHDRLVGNMLVGAGEIDGALVVVAADDGPRAQTLEHLEILDALRIRDGVVAITKRDLADPDRLEAAQRAVRDLLGRTTLRGAPVVAVSAATGDGMAELRAALIELRNRGAGRAPYDVVDPPAVRLAIDRVFSIRGRGTVVTGTLRGAAVSGGTTLRVVPGPRGASVRVREVQVHGRTVESAGPGRVALNLAIAGGAVSLERGDVLTAG